LNAEGTWHWNVQATDDANRQSTADQTFLYDVTLTDLKVPKSASAKTGLQAGFSLGAAAVSIVVAAHVANRPLVEAFEGLLHLTMELAQGLVLDLVLAVDLSHDQLRVPDQLQAPSAERRRAGDPEEQRPVLGDVVCRGADRLASLLDDLAVPVLDHRRNGRRHAGVGGVELGDGGCASHRPARVSEACCVGGEQTRRRGASVDVGDHRLIGVSSARTDGERNVVEAALCQSHRLGADADASAVQGRHGDAKAHPLSAEPVVRAHGHAVENQFARPRTRQAHLVKGLTETQSAAVRFDDKGADAASARSRACHHDIHTCGTAVGDESLGTGEAVAVAIPLGAR